MPPTIGQVQSYRLGGSRRSVADPNPDPNPNQDPDPPCILFFGIPDYDWITTIF
jgi:hypothetical protein